MQKDKTKSYNFVIGFTLIELLVVIAIIGLLTTLVLVNTSGTRGKARVAKALEFSSQVYNALGSEAVGIWNFDNGAGTVAYDTSGYGNNGTISGALFATDTPYSIVGSGTGKYSLNFDGTDDYVSVPSSTILSPTTALSVEAWAKTDSLPGAGIYPSLARKENEYSLRLNSSAEGNYFAFFVRLAGVWEPRAQGIVPTVGAWYHLVGTWDGTTIKLYVNGVIVDSESHSGAITPTSNALQFGTYGGGNYWDGPIDDVRIYSVALTASEIQKHYAEGLETHLNLTIDK